MKLGIEGRHALVNGARAANPARRLGGPSEFGDACADLCSAQAGFITCRNLLMDGGIRPGTF